MTSYKFWNPVSEFISSEFKTVNLGGWIVKAGKWPLVDNTVKEVLQ